MIRFALLSTVLFGCVSIGPRFSVAAEDCKDSLSKFSEHFRPAAADSTFVPFQEGALFAFLLKNGDQEVLVFTRAPDTRMLTHTNTVEAGECKLEGVTTYWYRGHFQAKAVTGTIQVENPTP